MSVLSKVYEVIYIHDNTHMHISLVLIDVDHTYLSLVAVRNTYHCNFKEVFESGFKMP